MPQRTHVSGPPKRLLGCTIEILVLVSVRLYRDGITEALQRDRRFGVVESSASLEGLREDLNALPRPPDVALVDVGVPHGVGTARALRKMWSSTSVVALAVSETDEDIVAWVEAGVAGLVSREATRGELLDTLEGAANHQLLCSPSLTPALLRRVASMAGEHPGDRLILTPREREVVRLIADGLSNKQIAISLGIELPTVKNHVHNILEKLRVGRRRDAFAVALARGELEPI